MRDLRTVQSGGAARRVVSGLETGRVVAVFRRSFYLADSDGALACVGAPSLGPGPLNLLCAPGEDIDFAELVRRDDRVAGRGNALDIGTSLRLRRDSESEWHPTPLAPGWRGETLSRGLAMLAALVETSRLAGGLCAIIAAVARREKFRDSPEDPLLRLATPAVAALADWLDCAVSARSASPPPASAASLLGLGPGLTPSGDDFLGGTMIALAALGRRDITHRIAERVLPLAVTQTSAVSAAHLAGAAAGEGAAPLHEMLSALVLGDERQIAAALARVAALGHSSGWDMLAGAALACAAVTG